VGTTAFLKSANCLDSHLAVVFESVGDYKSAPKSSW